MKNSMSIKKAALINAFAKYSTVIVNLISNAILARILTPSDYGIVAIISVFSSFFLVFADMGIGSAIIQNRDLTKMELNDIFTWTNYIGLFIMVTFSLFSYAIAAFYNNLIYVSLGFILSFSSYFTALSMVPNALLMREMKFSYVAIRNIFASILNFVCTLVLAINGFKAYAIVIGTVLNTLIIFILNYRGSKLKFVSHPRIASLKKIAGFSVYQFGYQFVNYFSRSLDNILAGKYLGDEALGYYDKSYKLMIYPINNFTAVINPVLHPILSTFQDNKKYIYDKYIKLVKLLAIVGGYCTIICFFLAEEIIRIIYGNMWIGAIMSFKILSLSIATQMVSSSAGAIYQSLGNTKLMFKSGITYMGTTVLSIIIGIKLGNINTLSLCVCVSLYIKFFIEFYFLINKCFGYSIFSFLKELIPESLSTFLSWLLLSIIWYYYPLNLSNLFQVIFIKLIITTLVFITFCYLTKCIKDLKAMSLS